MGNTPKNKRLILAILAVVVGLFMMYVTPFIIQTSLERVMVELTKVSAEKPAYSSGILLFSFLFPIYRGFNFVAGVSIIAIDLPTQVIRSLLTDATSVDYLIGSLLAAGLLFSILFPKFKKELVFQSDLQES